MNSDQSPAPLFPCQIAFSLFGIGPALIALLGCVASQLLAEPLAPETPVRGWTLLSRDEAKAMTAISAAADYEINHLQLSHKIVHDLNEVDDPETRALVNRLVDAAHQAGIEEVVLWDHALYPLDYYPEHFRSGPAGTIDLDNSWPLGEESPRAKVFLLHAKSGSIDRHHAPLS
ncbi:MAG: hypothetical protein SynsKO_38960 [Synoicihabitans sp.]